MSENERLDQVPEEELTAEPAAEETKSEKKPKADKSVDKKAKDKAKKKAKGNRFTRWLREMRSELKKVQWPTRKQTINNTLIVIACVIVVGIFIWIFDFIAGSAIDVLLTFLR